MMASPADYYASKRAPEGRFEIDLAGSGGTLSNGTITLGGFDFTLAGIGASSTLMNLYIQPTALLSSYDGAKHSVEIVADVVRNAWSQANTAASVGRKDSPISGAQPGSYVGRFQTAALYTVGSATASYLGIGSMYDTTETGSYTNIAHSTLDPKRMSGFFAGSAAIAAFRETTTGSPVRLAEDATALNYNWAVRDAAFGTSPVWGTGDYIDFAVLVFAGAAQTTTATQSASGITFTIGTSSITVSKLYIYIGTPEMV